MIRLAGFLFFCFTSVFVTAQDDLPLYLLHRIEALQVKEDGVFPKGSIPSYRTYALNKDRQKADPNPFYTGLVAMTLRDLRPMLTAEQAVIADRIILNAAPSLKLYKNKKRETYNFWAAGERKIFPNSGWMNWFDKSQSLPDDMDDTVIILLALQADNSIAKQVHDTMQLFANNASKKVNNTYKAYRNIGAYSTWFGKKMPIDFDICVLSNILYYVQRYELPWTHADSASLELITKVITEKKHLQNAAYVAPHYSRLPVILYHISRLMQVKPIVPLEKLKPQLVKEAEEALAGADSFMDQLILSTALLRWGVLPVVAKSHEGKSIMQMVEENDFSFFIANMASMLPDPLKQWMSVTGAGKFYYDCPAYNNLLFLEYLLLYRDFAKK